MSSESPPKSGTAANIPGLPQSLADLPSLSFVTRPAKSRAESQEPDVHYGITSWDKIVEKASAYFTKMSETVKKPEGIVGK